MTMKTKMSECSTCPAHLSALHHNVVSTYGGINT